MKKPTIVRVIILTTIGLVTATGIAQVNQVTALKHLMIATPGGLNVAFAANSIERHQPDLDVFELTGNVEIRSRDMILQADRATYDRNTGEIKPVGDVRLKLEPQR